MRLQKNLRIVCEPSKVGRKTVRIIPPWHRALILRLRSGGHTAAALAKSVLDINAPGLVTDLVRSAAFDVRQIPGYLSLSLPNARRNRRGPTVDIH